MNQYNITDETEFAILDDSDFDGMVDANAQRIKSVWRGETYEVSGCDLITGRLYAMEVRVSSIIMAVNAFTAMMAKRGIPKLAIDYPSIKFNRIS
jgi:hypothetical protein